MKSLWAPWRMEFLTDPKTSAPEGCVFCALIQENDDRKNLILHRGKHSFVLLNRYPYNNGHLMVVPLAHTAELAALGSEVMAEMDALLQQGIRALEKAYRPHGFNVGMNLGAAAGAGIRDHLHWHIVPRWIGDTNFMPVLAETKAMPQHLAASYDQLHTVFRGT